MHPDTTQCFLCGSTDWRALPIPADRQSITTSGIVLEEPLEREQCMSCGFLRKSLARFLGNSRFYEELYEGYYGRPGATHYDSARYTAMADWMHSALGNFAPKTVLDIGCGAGWQMRAFVARYGGVTIEGVEPSLANAEKARRAGFVVHTSRLGSEPAPRKEYDLVYANNVLQHVVDPVAFLSEVSHYVSADGCAAFILPDAEEPSCEILWSDHNFSLRAIDLAVLAKIAGFEVVLWQPNPANSSLMDKQLVILRKRGQGFETSPARQALYSIEELFSRRAYYIAQWRLLNEELRRRTSAYRRIFNFGSSMWTWQLAGYCPDYWSQVEACLVDGEYGQCIGKKVFPTNEMTFGKTDCIVLGVNPATQSAFAERLAGSGADLIMWSDLIRH